MSHLSSHHIDKVWCQHERSPFSFETLRTHTTEGQRLGSLFVCLLSCKCSYHKIFDVSKEVSKVDVEKVS